MTFIKRLTLGTLLLAACATATATPSVTETWFNKNLTVTFNSLIPNDTQDIVVSSRFMLSPKMFFTCYTNDLPRTPGDLVTVTINNATLTLDMSNGYEEKAKVWVWKRQINFAATWLPGSDTSSRKAMITPIQVTCSSFF